MTSPFNEPAPIRATESIKRQKKEQGAVSRLLNGVIITIVVFILLVTGAAGYGGYVMWQQIQGHSVTIAQAQADTEKKFAALRENFAEENRQLAENLALTNQQVVDLGRQLTEAQRTADGLRRAQVQLQRRLESQDAALERLRTRIR
jgi:uncharacterized protein HemX